MISPYFPVAEIDCDQLMAIPHTEHNEFVRSFSSTVTYICTNSDERFADGSNVMTVECIHLGVWNNTPSSCNGG